MNYFCVAGSYRCHGLLMLSEVFIQKSSFLKLTVHHVFKGYNCSVKFCKMHLIKLDAALIAVNMKPVDMSSGIKPPEL